MPWGIGFHGNQTFVMATKKGDFYDKIWIAADLTLPMTTLVTTHDVTLPMTSWMTSPCQWCYGNSISRQMMTENATCLSFWSGESQAGKPIGSKLVIE